MEDAEVEEFKVWPTDQNQDLFKTIVKGGRDAVRTNYRRYFYAKRDQIYDYNTTPRMLNAYGYFYDRIREAVELDSLQDELIEPDTDEVSAELSVDQPDQTVPRETKLDAIWQSLVEEFKVVEIVLEEGDDAQVIFETLNERGEALLAADLVRNHIFHRAEDADRRSAERLFKQYWGPFEDPFWSLEEKQGRYKKQRIEFFLANYIAAKIADDITITKLFSEYKAFLKASNFANIEAELKELSRFGAIYRELVERKSDTALGEFAARLALWDVTTVYPLVMQLWSQTHLDDGEKAAMLNFLLSFIVRRAVCGLTPKNYNKLFLAAVADLNQKGWSPASLKAFLVRQTAESARWPRDEEFQRNWQAGRTYTQLGPARTRAVLEELEMVKRTRFQESDSLKSGLTVEHVMPDQWRTHWLLDGGVKPTSDQVLQARWSINEDDSIVGQIVRRDRLKQNIGNLTLLTQSMNSKQSHEAWEKKRQALNDPKYGSLLVLNKEITAKDVWDETSIETRSKDLFKLAAVIWPGPADTP
jgi:hypothetical protein